MGRDTDHTEGIKSMKDDMISRQAAIDAVIKRDANCGFDSAEVLKTLPSAQPTDAEIQRMQDIEQAALEKAYECGKQDAMQRIPCEERLPEPGVNVLVDVYQEGGKE